MKKKTPTARQLAKKVHHAIHPLEHETPRRKTRKNASPTQKALNKLERTKKTASKRDQLGADMAREALADIKKAGKQFEQFTGLRAENVTPATHKTPRTAVVVGKLVAVIYEAERLDVEGYAGEDDVALYKHDFNPKNPPVLAVSPDGKQLLIVGGGYRFDAKRGGIVG